MERENWDPNHARRSHEWGLATGLPAPRKVRAKRAPKEGARTVVKPSGELQVATRQALQLMKKAVAGVGKMDLFIGSVATPPRPARTHDVDALHETVRSLQDQVRKQQREIERQHGEVSDLKGRLAAAQAARRIWRLSDVKRRIRAMASIRDLATEDLSALDEQLDRLHILVVANGIDCLPTPQVDDNPDATIDIVWFDQRNHSSLALTVLPEGDEDGRIWLRGLDSGTAFNIYEPTDDDLLAALRRFSGA